MNQNNLIPFKKGFDERRQNGRKAGSKNISTIIEGELKAAQWLVEMLPEEKEVKKAILVSRLKSISSIQTKKTRLYCEISVFYKIAMKNRPSYKERPFSYPIRLLLWNACYLIQS